MEPKMVQNGVQNGHFWDPNRGPASGPVLGAIWVAIWGVLGATWGPIWGPFGGRFGGASPVTFSGGVRGRPGAVKGAPASSAGGRGEISPASLGGPGPWGAPLVKDNR